MFKSTKEDEWSEALEVDTGLERSNFQAAKPEAASAEAFEDAVLTVSRKSDKCHELMKSRVIFADEANFTFNRHTRQERMAKIEEIEQNIAQLESRLGESEEGRAEIEKQIRSEKLDKIELVLEQSYADITYLMTRRETVTKLSDEMVEAARSGKLTKEQLAELLAEANALQKIYVSMGVSSAEAKQLIQYFQLEFKSDAIPILAKLTEETEVYSDLKIDIDGADKMVFEAKFEFWLNQLVKFDLNDEITQLIELQDSQEKLTGQAETPSLAPDDQKLAETTLDSESIPVLPILTDDKPQLETSGLSQNKLLSSQADEASSTDATRLTEKPSQKEARLSRAMQIKIMIIRVLNGIQQPNFGRLEKTPISASGLSSRAAMPLAA